MTDEELIEELSFAVYRRVSTMIFVPGDSHHASSVEMVAIDPRLLDAAIVGRRFQASKTALIFAARSLGEYGLPSRSTPESSLP